jgi:hypothetical protein
MVHILPKVPGFGERLGSAIGSGLGGGFQQGMSKAQEFAQKMELEKQKEQSKQKQDKKDLGGTFGTILDEMKNLKEHVGPLNVGALNPYSETSGKRSQINNLRLSLEGLFRDLTLKGQFPKAIYERILKELPSASDTESKYLNKIEGIEKILNAHYGEKESSGKELGAAQGKQKFNINNVEHKAKRDQLMKKFKNDREKVAQALDREFE